MNKEKHYVVRIMGYCGSRDRPAPEVIKELYYHAENESELRIKAIRDYPEIRKGFIGEGFNPASIDILCTKEICVKD